MLFTALAGKGSLEKPVHTLLRDLNAAEVTFTLDARAYDVEAVLNWWAEQAEVAALASPRAILAPPARPRSGDRELGSTILLTERSRDDTSIDSLRFQAGQETAAPKNSDIWIPSSLAAANELTIGDTLEVAVDGQVIMFTISAIVVDPQYSSGFLSPVRSWVAPGSLATFSRPGKLNEIQVSVALYEGASADALWDRFKAHLGGGFSGTALTRSTVLASYAQSIGILTALIMLFGVLALIVAVFIITSTVASDVTANYRNFGILKAIGFTPGNMLGAYLLQYAILAAVTTGLGFALGFLSTNALTSLMLSSIGGSLSPTVYGEAALPALPVLGLLIPIVAALVARRASRINAATAIRFGAPPTESSSTPWPNIVVAKGVGLPAVLALKELLTARARDLFDGVALTLTGAVILFAINVYQSTLDLGDNLPFWGLDGSDVRLTRDLSPAFGIAYERLREQLNDHREVATSGGILNAKASLLTQDQSSFDIDGHVIDGNLNHLGYLNLEGRNPQSSEEISIGYPLADRFGIALGETISLHLRGQRLEFRVVGIFQGTSNGGLFYRCTLSGAQRAVPFLEPSELILKLHDRSTRGDFIARLQQELGQAAQVETSEKLVESQLAQVAGGLGSVLSAIALSLLAIAGTSILNSTSMGIEESKRQLGVYKALGMTAGQIRGIKLCKALLLACLGAIAGALLYSTLATGLMNSMMHGAGMREFPLTTDHGRSLLMPALLAFIALLSAWIPSQRITRLPARELILSD